MKLGKEIDPEFVEKIRKSILEGFQSDESFAYMKGDPRWEQLMEE